MKRILLSSCLLATLVVDGFAAGKGPEIQIVDGRVSIQAESITLSRFLHLLDAATGMTSKVAPELANQKISVRLADLDLKTAIRKSFQGQPWNYAIVEGKGITIIDRAVAATASTSSISSAPVQTFISDPRNDNPLPPIPTASPFGQPTPVQPNPTPNNNANNNNSPMPISPGGVINLPPAQGGNPMPVPTFQPIGGSLGVPLPGTQPTSK